MTWPARTSSASAACRRRGLALRPVHRQAGRHHRRARATSSSPRQSGCSTARSASTCSPAPPRSRSSPTTPPTPMIVAADLVGQAEHGHEKPGLAHRDSTPLAESVMARVPELIAPCRRPRATRRAPPGATMARSSVCDTREESGRGLRPLRAASISRCMRRPRLVAREPHQLRLAVPRRGDHGRLRRQGVAARTTSCRPRVRRATPAGSRCTSSSRPLTWQRMTREACREIGAVTARISRLEGMEAHARTADAPCASTSRSEGSTSATPVEA